MANQKLTVQVLQIHNSRKIILELMETQGYNVKDYSNFNINEVNTMIQNNQLDMLLETEESKITETNPKKNIYIRYYLTSKISPKNIHEMIEDLFVLSETLKKSDCLFIIIKDDPNETLINEIKHIWETEGIFIVVENIKRLQFNILKHVLVPQHYILPENEVVEIMKKYNISNKTLFPDISRFDPVARIIGLRPGQVCHIIRDSKTSITADYYRICI